MRWWGLYTQRSRDRRRQDAILEPESMDDKVLHAAQCGIDGGRLTTDQLRVIGDSQESRGDRRSHRPAERAEAEGI